MLSFFNHWLVFPLAPPFFPSWLSCPAVSARSVFFFFLHKPCCTQKMRWLELQKDNKQEEETCCTTWLRWPRFPALESISAASASVCRLNTDNYKIWRLIKRCSRLNAECFMCVQVQCTWWRHRDTTVDRHGGFHASFTQEIMFLCSESLFSHSSCVCVEDLQRIATCIAQAASDFGGNKYFLPPPGLPPFQLRNTGKKIKAQFWSTLNLFLFLPTFTSRVKTPNGFLGQREGGG